MPSSVTRQAIPPTIYLVSQVITVLLLAVVNVFVASIVAGTTRAAAQGRLGPNRFAGIRTTATLSSPTAWSAGHQAAWPVAAFITIMTVPATTVALVILIAGHGHAAILISYAAFGATVLGLIALIKIANHAARTAPPPARPGQATR